MRELPNNPYFAPPQICPECKEVTYLYGHTYSFEKNQHWFYCWICGYENNEETWPIQSSVTKVNQDEN